MLSCTLPGAQVVLLGEEMGARHGLRPNQVVCNCVLLACQRTSRWREAVEQLDRMERMGVQADARSYASVIVACECAGEGEGMHRSLRAWRVEGLRGRWKNGRMLAGSGIAQL